MRASPFRTTLTILAVLLTAQSLPAQVTRHYKVVALQGDPANIAGTDATIGIVGVDPRIGPNGDVVFGGFVANNGAANYAIWSGPPREPQPVAVQGDVAPGRPGETLDVFFGSSAASYWILENGAVGFHARVAPTRDEGYWLGRPGAVEEVAIVGNAVPGIPDATFKSFPGLRFLANGQSEVMVQGTIEGGTVTTANDTALWIGQPGALEILAREGSPAPGTPGANFKALTFSEFSLNAVGDYCLTADVTGSINQNEVLFAGPSPGFTKVLREGELIGPRGGEFWKNFGKPRLNNDGTILFEHSPPGDPRAFFTRTSARAITQIAAELDAPPGAPDAEFDKFFFSKPALAGNDYAGFNAGLGPDANFDKDGTWITHRGTTELVARKGDPVPGLPGQNFTQFQPWNAHRAPAINASGTAIIRAQTNAGVNGIWRWKDGDLQLLMAVGDIMDLGSGDLRRVADFSVQLGSGGQSGVPSGFNDCGQLVFRVSFNSGALGTAIMMIEDVEDCDGDGVDSLLEEAFGGDPFDRTDGPSVLPRIYREGAQFIVSYFRKDLTLFNYEIEKSVDLQSWQKVSPVLVRIANQDGVPPGTERVDTRHALAPNTAHYFRVRVTRK